MKKIVLNLTLLMALIPLGASAEGLVLSGSQIASGFGLELSKDAADSLTARLGFSTDNAGSDKTRKMGSYEQPSQSQLISALADWYPLHSRFRATGGLFYNRNNAMLSAANPANPYDTNYADYSLGGLQGGMTSNVISPYIGIGWGNPVEQIKGWNLTSDLGLMFQGSLSQLTSNAAALSTANIDQVHLQDSLPNFKLLPVARVGISYQW